MEIRHIDRKTRKATDNWTVIYRQLNTKTQISRQLSNQTEKIRHLNKQAPKHKNGYSQADKETDKIQALGQTGI